MEDGTGLSAWCFQDTDISAEGVQQGQGYERQEDPMIWLYKQRWWCGCETANYS